MIKSMTGYGDASAESGNLSYFVEIKTVNNRYLKTNIKLPEILGFLEEDIEKLIKKNIHRGTVNVLIRLKGLADTFLFDLDQDLLEAYLFKLKSCAESASVDFNVNMVDLLSLPGVMQPRIPDEAEAVKLREAAIDVTSKAIEKLVGMRAEEGKAVAADMIGHCRDVEKYLKIIRERSPVVVEEYYEKLKSKTDKLLSGCQIDMDEEILARELAVFAERCDISEEIARLESHLNQFLMCCNGQEAAGRKLDFICQEMLRETNTIASKASDTEICNSVVEIKCRIDRIKEQVQNVE